MSRVQAVLDRPHSPPMFSQLLPGMRSEHGPEGSVLVLTPMLFKFR